MLKIMCCPTLILKAISKVVFLNQELFFGSRPSGGHHKAQCLREAFGLLVSGGYLEICRGSQNLLEVVKETWASRVRQTEEMLHLQDKLLA